jgi:hypothetical protein
MKATKGDPITCKCGKAGWFLQDIKDNAAITSRDIAIELKEIDNGGYRCPTCLAVVAQQVSQGIWKVFTPNGWVE